MSVFKFFSSGIRQFVCSKSFKQHQYQNPCQQHYESLSVSHPGTSLDQCCLASEFKWEQVIPTQQLNSQVDEVSNVVLLSDAWFLNSDFYLNFQAGPQTSH